MKKIPLLVFSGMLLSVTLSRAVETPRPNVLLIVSDDQGYADAGFQGSKDIPTPNLDRLAQSGVQFTSGYVTHPFCSPTRAGLMTGRYQQRFGHERNPYYDPSDRTEGLPTSETLLPQHLVRAGYVTGWIGKWHLGAAPEFAPGKRGFQETYGFIGGMHRYRDWKPDITDQSTSPIERNGVAVEPPEHLTTALGEEAAAFVRRHQSEPWFLYLAFNAPHSPNEPTPERMARFASIADPNRRAYAAQMSLMDDAIGEALGALRDSGQTERTLVFFFNDNGVPAGNGGSNAPLRGRNGEVYEGGVRVPFLIAWPGKIVGGVRDDRPVSSVDVFATTLAVAGAPMPTDKKYDSVNLLPYLTGEKAGAPHERLYWRSGRRRAVREGHWKLVHMPQRAPELYDLSVDLSETTDLANKYPAETARLSAALEAWNRELIEPVFAGSKAERPGQPDRMTNQTYSPKPGVIR